MKFDGERTFARFDGVDFARFAIDGRINRPMVETVLEPFGKTTLNRVDAPLGGRGHPLLPLLLHGQPRGARLLVPACATRVTAMVEPLRRARSSRSAGASAPARARAGSRSATAASRGVVDARAAAEPRVRSALGDVTRGLARAARNADGSSIFVARRDGELVGASTAAARTWAARWRSTTRPAAFAAPATAAASTPTASRLAGPPKQPLARARRRHVDGARVSSATGTRLGGDGARLRLLRRRLRGARRQAAPRRSERPRRAVVAGLGEADPYVVWRLWLDKPTARDRLPFYTTARFRFTDSLAIYSAFQEPFVSWARRTGGSVVEVHAYADRARGDGAGRRDPRGDVARADVAPARARRRARAPRRVPAAVELHALGAGRSRAPARARRRRSPT